MNSTGIKCWAIVSTGIWHYSPTLKCLSFKIPVIADPRHHPPGYVRERLQLMVPHQGNHVICVLIFLICISHGRAALLCFNTFTTIPRLTVLPNNPSHSYCVHNRKLPALKVLKFLLNEDPQNSESYNLKHLG